jgi:hypothetical protein
VRLYVAGALSSRSLLGPKEDGDAEGHRKPSGRGGHLAFVASEEDGGNGKSEPQPTVAPPRGADHPEANPLRRAPAVNAAHQAMVARLDKILHLWNYAHGGGSFVPISYMNLNCCRAVTITKNIHEVLCFLVLRLSVSPPIAYDEVSECQTWISFSSTPVAATAPPRPLYAKYALKNIRNGTFAWCTFRKF